MKLTRKFAEMTPEKRPARPGPRWDRPALRDHGARRRISRHHAASYQAIKLSSYQAIKLIDADGRSCIYVPITHNGKVVDSHGFLLDPADE